MSIIDLSLLPPPNIVAPLDYETILNNCKQDLLSRVDPTLRPALQNTLDLESEPLTKLLENIAYRTLILRQNINDAALAVMVAYATKSDLDNLGALFNVTRLVIKAADPTTTPPTPAVMESDDALRKRIPQSFEGLSVAGPSGSYEFFARSADGRVLDAKAVSPSPACVTVSVLSTENDGTASQELLDIVSRALNDEDTRPVADRLTVQSAEIIPYKIDVTVYVKQGPEMPLIQEASQDNLDAYIAKCHQLAGSVYLSAIDAAATVEGVIHVVINEPKADIILTKAQAPYCISRTVTPKVDNGD